MAVTSLGSIDPAVITRIIREADDSLDELRLISPVWNTTVGSFLTGSGRLGTVERVYVYSGLASDDDNDEERSSRLGQGQDVQMVAILPERHSRNVGVGEWLSVYQKHTVPEAIEVASSPQRSQVLKSNEASEKNEMQPQSSDESIDSDAQQTDKVEPAVIKQGADLAICMMGIVPIAILLCYSIIGFNIFGVMIVIGIIYSSTSESGEVQEKEKKSSKEIDPTRDLLAYYSPFLPMGRMAGMKAGLAGKVKDTADKEAEKKYFPQLARFIGMYSRIETLVLEEPRYAMGGSGLADAMGATLGGDVQIDRLEVRICDARVEVQNSLVEMCRSHRVRHLFLKSMTSFRLVNFSEFVAKLTALDVTVDIYEGMGTGHQVYFNKSRLFWDKMVAKLATEDVTMQMTTVHDAAFAAGGYGHYTTAHIRCEKAPGTARPMVAVDTKRGFNLRGF